MVPQQPPMMFTPYSVTNRSSQSASRSGSSGKYVSSPRVSGSPAFGSTLSSLRAVPAQVPDAVEHQVRADAAVHADHVDLVERFERDERRRDVRARAASSGSCVDDGELHHQRQPDAGALHLLDGGDRDALRLEDVEARLDQDRVDAAPRS